MTPREGSIVAERYRLLRKVGGGKMASVWQVFDEVSEEQCALKLLAETMQGHPEALSRFSLEDRISREVKGPYFAERLGSGSWRSSRYIAWRWHEGESLRALLERNSPLDAPSLHAIVSEVAKALGIVHAAGYVHGDVKPENIFFARAPGELSAQLKLFGFGVASRIAQRKGRGAGRRRPGQVVGTPLYLSPSRVKGHVACEPAADIWSLGVVVYESLTGRMPFMGSDEAEVYEAVLDKRAPLPSEVARVPSTVDLWWRQVLNEELHSVEDFLLSLGRALAPALRTANTQRSPALKTLPKSQSLPSQAKPPGSAGPKAKGNASPSVARSAEATVSGAGPVVPRTTDGETLQAGAGPQGSKPRAAGRREGEPPHREATRGTLAGTGGPDPAPAPSDAAQVPVGGVRDLKPAATLPLPSSAGAVARAAAAANVSATPADGSAPPEEKAGGRAPRQFTPYPRQPTHLVLDGSRKTLVGLTPLMSIQPPSADEDQANGGAAKRDPHAIEGSPMRTIEGSRPEGQQSDPSSLGSPPAIRKPRYPTVPFPLPNFAAPASSSPQASPSVPAAMRAGGGDTQREGTQPARPSRGSGTLQIPIPGGGRQPQIVAGIVVCVALVLVLAVISRGPGEPIGDFESATLSAHPQSNDGDLSLGELREERLAPPEEPAPAASAGLEAGSDADPGAPQEATSEGAPPAAKPAPEGVSQPTQPASLPERGTGPSGSAPPRPSREKELAPGLVVPEDSGKVKASKKPVETPREPAPRAPATPAPAPEKVRKGEPTHDEYDFGI